MDRLTERMDGDESDLKPTATLAARIAGLASDGKHRFSKSQREGLVLLKGIGVEGDAHAGPFGEHAELPKNLGQAGPKKSARKRSVRKVKESSAQPDKAADRKAAQAYERERQRREREEAREEAAQRKERERGRRLSFGLKPPWIPPAGSMRERCRHSSNVRSSRRTVADRRSAMGKGTIQTRSVAPAGPRVGGPL